MKRLFGLFLIIAFTIVMFGEKPTTNLATLYKSKKVHLKKVLTVDTSTMSESEFLVSPMAMTEDDEGNIYVTDFSNNNIKMFSPEGKFVKVIGQMGAGPGDIHQPSLIVYTDDQIIVADNGNQRFSIFSKSGAFSKSIRYDSLSFPMKIRTSQKKIFIQYEKIMGPGKPQIVTIKMADKFIENAKEIYSHDIVKNRFITQPSFQNIPQPFPALVHWDVSSQGNIIIGYSGKYEIEIHHIATGKVTRFSHKYEPVKVNDKDKEKFFNGLVFFQDGKRIKKIPGYITKHVEFPECKPAFREIIVDEDGNILVFLYSDMGTAGEWFDAFDSSGRFIEKVIMTSEKPVNIHNLSPGRNGTFWEINTNTEEDPIITMYRISK